MAQSRATEFMDLYRSLEAALRAEYDIDRADSPVYWAARNHAELRRMRDDLDCCREIRNLLAHNPAIAGSPAVEPSEEALEVLRRALRLIEKPPLALDAGVRTPSIFTRTLGDLVRPALQTMVEKDYSHVPIVDDGHVVGIFSESNLLTLHAMRESVLIDAATRFTDLAEALPLEAHREAFPFIARDATLEAAADLFEAAEARGVRIGLLLVTQNGRPTERLLGIVSASDVAAAL